MDPSFRWDDNGVCKMSDYSRLWLVVIEKDPVYPPGGESEPLGYPFDRNVLVEIEVFYFLVAEGFAQVFAGGDPEAEAAPGGGHRFQDGVHHLLAEVGVLVKDGFKVSG